MHWLLLFLLLPLGVFAECSDLVSGQIVSQDTILCKGTYFIDAPIMLITNALLYCDGALLVGNGTAIVVSDSHAKIRNCVFDGFDVAVRSNGAGLLVERSVFNRTIKPVLSQSPVIERDNVYDLRQGSNEAFVESKQAEVQGLVVASVPVNSQLDLLGWVIKIFVGGIVALGVLLCFLPKRFK